MKIFTIQLIIVNEHIPHTYIDHAKEFWLQINCYFGNSGRYLITRTIIIHFEEAVKIYMQFHISWLI